MSNDVLAFATGAACRYNGRRVLWTGISLISILCCCQSPTTPQTAPAITTQPVSQTKILGQCATFTVIASGNPAPMYQWRKAGVNIAGATDTNYTIASVALTDAGAYDAVVTNSQGSVTSTAATLTVTTTGCPRPDTAQPIDQNDPVFRFISPNGGETFHVGDQCTVKVTSQLFVASAVLYVVIGRYNLSPQSGIMATTLQGNSAVSTVIFTVTDSLMQQGGGNVSSVSDSCLIKISSYSNPLYMDYSDCYFRIKNP